MPIQGITSNPRNLTDGLPLLATINKGSKKPNDKQPGKDLEYFRVEFQNQYRHLQLVWDEMYHQPTQIENILILGDTLDTAFSSWREEWRKTGLLHRCDGVTQVRHFEGSRYSDTPIPCAQSCQCKPIGRLSVLIPDFYDVTEVYGKFVFTTHSITEIAEIHALLGTMFKTAGNLSRIRFAIGRYPRKMNVEIDGKRMQIEKSLVYLVPNAHDIEDTIALRHNLVLQGNNPNTPQLPPATITHDENGVTQDNIQHWVYDKPTYEYLETYLADRQMTIPMTEYLIGKPLLFYSTTDDFNRAFKQAWSGYSSPLSAFLVLFITESVGANFTNLDHLVNWWQKHSVEFLTPDLTIPHMIKTISDMTSQPTDNPFLNAKSDNKAVQGNEVIESPELPLQSDNWGKSDMSDIPF